MNVDQLPLGFAVMVVRGATTDLSDALACLDFKAILVSRMHLANALLSYRRSKDTAPKDSLVTGVLLSLGQEAAIVAEIKLKTASDSLKSNLKLV